MKQPPYFNFYPADWLESDRIFCMTLEQEGSYIRLLAAMWRRGAEIKDDPRLICNILRCTPSKWKKIRSVFVDDLQVFEVENGLLFNRKMTRTFHDFCEKSKKNSKNISKRWQNEKGMLKKNIKKTTENHKMSDTTVSKSYYYTDTDTDTDTEKEKEKEKEKPKSEKNQPRFNAKKFRPEWIEENDWEDILDHRKRKRAQNTKRALASFVREVKKATEAGWTVTQCVDEMTNRGWAGFKAGWMRRESATGERAVTVHQENMVSRDKVAMALIKRRMEKNGTAKTGTGDGGTVDPKHAIPAIGNNT